MIDNFKCGLFYNGVVGYLLLLVILLMGLILWRRWLPALVVMPITAIVIAIIAQAQYFPTQSFKAFEPVFTVVIEEGMPRLVNWIIAVLLGCIMASHISINGTAETIIRWTAEFGGDRKLNTTLLLTGVIALLFTTLGGLGAVIMVSSLALPLMLALRIPPVVAGTAFLMGLSLGGCFNPANWAAYLETLGLNTSVVINFACVVALFMGVVTYIYLFVKLHDKRDSIWSFILVIVLLPAAWILTVNISPEIQYLIFLILGAVLLLILAILLILPLIEILILLASNKLRRQVVPAQLMAPIVPLVILIITALIENIKNLKIPAEQTIIVIPEFKIGIISALFIGIFYSFLASVTRDRSAIRDITQAMIQGAQQAAAPIILLIGIGMLLKATMLPEVAAAIQPLIIKILPKNELVFVLLFTIIAPLAMYRGPLNLYGMGAGLLKLLALKLSPQRVMATFLSVGQLQGVSDPTNTHNVYLADRLGLPVQELTLQSMPWVWGAVFVSLIAASYLTPLIP